MPKKALAHHGPRQRQHFWMVVLLIFAAGSGGLHATEGGGTSKAVGVDTVMTGVMPPPGLRLTTFASYYQAGKTLDGAGNERRGLSNFDLTAEALTLRVQYVWPGVELLGANVETRVGLTAYLKSEVSFDVQTPVGPLRRKGSVESGGDMLLAPVLLGYRGETFHQTTGLQLFLPTGSFNASALANPGRGYRAIGAVYNATWLPNPETELNISANYLVNSRNPDTNYTSGREASIDYGAGYKLHPTLQVGASGYLYKQVTNDEQNGQKFSDGNRGQALAIGPFVRYRPNDKWGIVFKWQHETKVENRASGNRFFLQFATTLF